MSNFIAKSILSAAVAAVPVLALSSAASAQYRVNTGNVLDANNRVGGDRTNPNDSEKRTPGIATGNEVVTGNVTGGKQFRGRVDYTDPRAFRGGSAGTGLDDFVRQSSGPDARLAETVQPFYGAGRGVAPPPGYVETGVGTGAYIPPGTTVTRTPGDLRLGDLNPAQPQMMLPQPGELTLPGPVDPSAGQTYITASPLYGIRQYGQNDPNFGGITTHTQYNPTSNRLDAQSIEALRNELNRASGFVADQATAPGQQQQQSGTSVTSEAGGAGGAGGAGARPQPGVAQPVQGAVPIEQQPITNVGGVGPAQPINNAIAANAGDLNTNQGTRQRLVNVAPPQQQSALYADLLKRHQEAANDRNISDVEASRRFNELQRAQAAEKQQQAGAPGAPGAPGAGGQQAPGAPGGAGGVGGPGGGMAGAAAPGAASPTADPKASGPDAALPGGIPDYAKQGEALLKQAGEPKDRRGAGAEAAARKTQQQPMKVPSLAQGMRGKGLAEIMKAAEDLMKQGKFTSALDQYDQAEQVAQNNPLIKLGRAHAELGAAYYGRADAHLREVFTANPELLVAQYDLTSMVGEQRLQTIVRDLKEVAKKDQKAPQPVFLLAYIAYNTAHEQNAEAYLDLADRRSGGKDPFFKLLRDNWSLPQGAKPANPGAAPAAPAAAPAAQPANPATPPADANK